MADKKYAEHWPVIILVILVTLIFVVSLLTFQVGPTEHAWVLQFGKPARPAAAGLHVKWPWPIESVWRQDKRTQTYEGDIGAVETVFTKDHYNIIVTNYINFRIGGTEKQQKDFLTSVNNLTEARKKLNTMLRSTRASIIGGHEFGEIINIPAPPKAGEPDTSADLAKTGISKIEEEIKTELAGKALEQYGIEVQAVGFKYIGLPDSVTNDVFARMQKDREKESREITAKGEAEAERLRANADLQYATTVARAEQEAKNTRSTGDREAAQYYAEFKKNPELAAFLRKLDSLQLLGNDGETTLILDPTIPPFDLLRGDALDKLRASGALKSLAPAPAPAPAGK